MGNARRESWVWLVALFSLANMIESGFWNQMNVFTPLYLPQLGVPAAQVNGWIGLIGVTTSLIGLPLLPFWGALADRYARQPVIVRSFVAHLLAGLLGLLAQNVWVFILARAMGSFALGNTGLMMTTLSERTPPRRMGLAFGIMSGAGPLGAFLGPLIGGPVVDRWGFRTLLGIDALVMVGVVLAMSFGYRDHFVGTNRGSLPRMAVASIGIIWRSPRLRALFPALFVLFAGWLLAFSYIGVTVKTLYRGNPADLGTVTGVVVGLGGAVTLILSPTVGALADRFGRWRVLFAALGLEVLLWPLPALAPDMVTFALAWAALAGVAASVSALAFGVLTASTTPAVRGRVMAFAYLPNNLGFLFGAALGGVLTTRFGVLIVFPVAAVLTLCGIAALAVAHRQPIASNEQRAMSNESSVEVPVGAGSGKD